MILHIQSETLQRTLVTASAEQIAIAHSAWHPWTADSTHKCDDETKLGPKNGHHLWGRLPFLGL